MSDSDQHQASNVSAGGEGTGWTKDQWNAYVANKEFIQYYTEKGIVDTAKLVQTIGMQGYLMLMENCSHLVVYKDKVYHADTREGQNLLESVLKRGELPLATLAAAGIIPGDKADDLIQDAISIASECLQPGAMWDDEAYKDAMLWAPDQWRESMRYSDFARHFVHGGIVQLPKLKKDMPPELLKRMINRSLNLVSVEEHVIDADTDEGIHLLERALVDGKISLARLIEADVFTRGEAVHMHQEAVTFAEKHLKKGVKWTEEERKSVASWIPEQWDAFVDTPQFDAFIEDGFVDVQGLKTLMGAQDFNIMLGKVHTLVDVGSRVITASTEAGERHLQDAAEHGKISLKSLVYAGVLTGTDVQKRIEEAQKISQFCFREGAKWDSLSERDAMKWSTDEWNAAITGIQFAERFVEGGIVQKDRFVGIMSTKLFSRMVDRSSFLIHLDNQVLDIRTARGKEFAETGLWGGEVPIHAGVEMGFIDRDQAAKLYEEAKTIASRNFREGVQWDEKDREAAKKWSQDQWEKALQVVNFSELFTKHGVVDRDKAVVAMGPGLFDAMVKHVGDFVSVGSTVYDASTKEGYNWLKEMKVL